MILEKALILKKLRPNKTIKISTLRKKIYGIVPLNDYNFSYEQRFLTIEQYLIAFFGKYLLI